MNKPGIDKPDTKGNTHIKNSKGDLADYSVRKYGYKKIDQKGIANGLYSSQIVVQFHYSNLDGPTPDSYRENTLFMR
jgi:hypothetical protein